MSREIIVLLILLLLSAGCASNPPLPGKEAASLSRCNYRTQSTPHHGLKDSEHKAQQLSGIWNTAHTAGGPGFEIFRCEFSVPTPPLFFCQSIFLWCGVEQNVEVSDVMDKSFGVLQPVLMFGPDCVENTSLEMKLGPAHDPTYESNPYWYYSAQYIYPEPAGATTYKCTTGPIFKAVPGETLISSIIYDPIKELMTVKIASADGTRTSVLAVAHPLDDPHLSWETFINPNGDQIVLDGALEIPKPVLLPMLPDEILQGWKLRASIASLHPFSIDAQWKLKPDSANMLEVKCNYEPSTHTSKCVWKRKPGT